MKRRTLIIGNALLFAACLPACDDDPAPGGGDLALTVDGGGDGARPDLTPTDGTVDQRVIDEGPAADMSEPDQSAADMSAPDQSAADMSAADMSAPDQSPPDMAAPDQSPPDMAAPDQSPPDMAPPDGCEALRGQPCQPQDDGTLGCCDSQGLAVIVCEQGTYREPVNYFGCGCEPGGVPPQQVFCAVPGFVGVHRSGWQPREVLRLRRGARLAA